MHFPLSSLKESFSLAQAKPGSQATSCSGSREGKSVHGTPTILRSGQLFCSFSVSLVSRSPLTAREAGKCCSQLGSFEPSGKHIPMKEGGRVLMKLWWSPFQEAT